MKDDAVTLFHGLIIDPVEDSTSDNLSGLAELLGLCEEAGLDVRLGTFPAGPIAPDEAPSAATVLQLEASGSVEDVAPVARSAAAFAIFPDIAVPSPTRRTATSSPSGWLASSSPSTWPPRRVFPTGG